LKNIHTHTLYLSLLAVGNIDTCGTFCWVALLIGPLSGVMLLNAINARKPHQRSIHSLGSGSTPLRFWSWCCSCNFSL